MKSSALAILVVVAALLRGAARASCAPLVCVCLSAWFVSNVSAQTAGRDRSGSTSKNPPATTKNSGKKPPVYKTVDPCAVADPDVSLVFGPGIPGVQAASDGGKYHSGEVGCGLFVVDITVPSDSSAPSFLPAFLIESGAIALTVNGNDVSNGTNYLGGFARLEKVCSAYRQKTRIFVKLPDTNNFALIRSVSVKGTPGYNVGKPDKCVLVSDIGKSVLSLGLPFGFQPSQSGARVYRVAVGAELAIQTGIWQQVRVKASHEADIK